MFEMCYYVILVKFGAIYFYTSSGFKQRPPHDVAEKNKVSNFAGHATFSEFGSTSLGTVREDVKKAVEG